MRIRSTSKGCVHRLKLETIPIFPVQCYGSALDSSQRMSKPQVRRSSRSSSDGDGFDIAVVGSHFCAIYISCDRLPAPGETVQGRDFVPLAEDGGKGSNQALCARRLGATVAFIGCVGKDPAGDMLAESFRRENVDTRHLRRSSTTTTGAGIAFVDGRGENMCVVDGGANRELTRAHIASARMTLAKARFLLTQFELPHDLALFAARTAHDLGVTSVLTPGPVPDLEDGALSGVDILTPNQTEGNVLAGYDPHEKTDPEKVVARIHDRLRVPNVVMTLGRHGVFALCEGETFAVPAFEVSVVNTTGAGDAFTGGLVAARLREAPWPQAIETGCAVAAISVTGRVPWRSYPTAARVRAFLRERGRDCVL